VTNDIIYNILCAVSGIIYIIDTMKTNVLIADDYMGTHRLLRDVIEICIKRVKVESAVSQQNFWDKLPASPEHPWHLIFISADYLNDEPECFIDRIKTVNPDVVGKYVIIGTAEEAESCGDAVKDIPFLVKPFSLDKLEDLIKQICGV